MLDQMISKGPFQLKPVCDFVSLGCWAPQGGIGLLSVLARGKALLLIFRDSCSCSWLIVPGSHSCFATLLPLLTAETRENMVRGAACWMAAVRPCTRYPTAQRSPAAFWSGSELHGFISAHLIYILYIMSFKVLGVVIFR